MQLVCMVDFREPRQRVIASLGASDVLANVPSVPLLRDGGLSIHIIIDNGSGSAPSDTPVGTFELWTSGDGVNYERQTSTVIDAELAKIATNTNTLVRGCANFTGVPGIQAKVIYTRTSGGATSRARLSLVVG